MALAAPDAERPQPTRPGSNGQSTEAGPSTTPARRTGESTSALRRRQFPPLLVAGSSSGFDSRPLRRCSQGDASWAHTAQSVARGVCGQKAGQALPAKGCGQAAREPPPKQPVQSVAWCGATKRLVVIATAVIAMTATAGTNLVTEVVDDVEQRSSSAATAQRSSRAAAAQRSSSGAATRQAVQAGQAAAHDSSCTRNECMPRRDAALQSAASRRVFDDEFCSLPWRKSAKLVIGSFEVVKQSLSNRGSKS